MRAALVLAWVQARAALRSNRMLRIQMPFFVVALAGCGLVHDLDHQDPDRMDASTDASIVGRDASALSDSGVRVDGGSSSLDAAGACVENSDCSLGQYCAKDIGNCPGAGVCTPIPAGFCQTIAMPTCGCDHVTYANPCTAAAEGVNVHYVGDSCEGVVCQDRAPVEGCCFRDADCADPTGLLRCVGEVCDLGGEGTCVAAELSPGQCWEDRDCVEGTRCVDAVRCPCGAACFREDQPGTCAAAMP